MIRLKAERKEDSEIHADAVNVASATECTGIVPALPEDGGGDLDARRLYDLPKPAKARKPRY